jgi:hypothetical protein
MVLPFQLLDCVYYLNAGLNEEGQDLVALAPPSASGCSFLQTSSIEFTGASSLLVRQVVAEALLKKT